MRKEEVKDFGGVLEQEKEVSKYEPPRIKTYTSEEIMEQIGPAMACTSGDAGPG